MKNSTTVVTTNASSVLNLLMKKQVADSAEKTADVSSTSSEEEEEYDEQSDSEEVARIGETRDVKPDMSALRGAPEVPGFVKMEITTEEENSGKRKRERKNSTPRKRPAASADDVKKEKDDDTDSILIVVPTNKVKRPLNVNKVMYRNMRQLQRTKLAQFPFPFKPFLREVRDYVRNALGKPDIRFKREALKLLHQDYMNNAVELATDITEHAEMNGRVEPVETDAVSAIKLSLLRHGYHVAPACRRSVESGRYDYYPLASLKKTVACTKRATTNSNRLGLLEKAEAQEKLRSHKLALRGSVDDHTEELKKAAPLIYQKLL